MAGGGGGSPRALVGASRGLELPSLTPTATRDGGDAGCGGEGRGQDSASQPSGTDLSWHP